MGVGLAHRDVNCAFIGNPQNQQPKQLDTKSRKTLYSEHHSETAD